MIVDQQLATEFFVFIRVNGSELITGKTNEKGTAKQLFVIESMRGIWPSESCAHYSFWLVTVSLVFNDPTGSFRRIDHKINELFNARVGDFVLFNNWYLDLASQQKPMNWSF